MPDSNGEMNRAIGRLIGAVEGMEKSFNDFRDEMRDRIDKSDGRFNDHLEEHALLFRTVANLSEWANGDDKTAGAKEKLNRLETARIKHIGFMSCLALVSGFAGHKIEGGYSFITNLFK